MPSAKSLEAILRSPCGPPTHYVDGAKAEQRVVFVWSLSGISRSKLKIKFDQFLIIFDLGKEMFRPQPGELKLALISLEQEKVI